jgi:DNA-binding transcriptional ArsR family regulator
MTDAASALDALGDPTRRRVLGLLRARECTVGELTDALGLSQPAVSQHLRILESAALVTKRPAGTRRYYRLDGDGLAEARAWLDTLWDDVLDHFTAFAESAPSLTETESTNVTPARPPRRSRPPRTR